jgi:hypothetical protein
MKDFNYYCNYYPTDKGDKAPNGNHYASWYDNWFSKIRNEVTNVCEIGVEHNGSLLAMSDYFPNANFIGLDIKDKSQYNSKRINTKILNQGDTIQLDNFVLYCNENKLQFDIIIDDGSHDVGHQQMTFGKFFQLIKPGGIYIIEDMGTSYLEPGANLYGFPHSQIKANNTTIDFLNERPFSSFWISPQDTEYINRYVDYVSIFDRANLTCTYKNNFKCKNGYQIRSITSIIQKIK